MNFREDCLKFNFKGRIPLLKELSQIVFAFILLLQQTVYLCNGRNRRFFSRFRPDCVCLFSNLMGLAHRFLYFLRARHQKPKIFQGKQSRGRNSWGVVNLIYHSPIYLAKFLEKWCSTLVYSLIFFLLRYSQAIDIFHQSISLNSVSLFAVRLLL